MSCGTVSQSDKFSLPFGLAVAYVLLASGSAAAQSAKKIATNTFPSVVLITMEDRNGQPVSLASGFFVAPGVVATNYHVVDGGSSGSVKIVGKRDTIRIDGTVGTDRRHDLALLAVKHNSAPSMRFAAGPEPQVGETVYAVGNPRGLEGTFSQGIISGIRRFDDGSLLQITAPISPGSSGGPVLNAKGEIIGVAVATLRGGQNLNFAIPVNRLKLLLDRRGALTPLRAAKRAPRFRSILDDLGGNVIEGVSIGAFEWKSRFDIMDRQEFTLSIKKQLSQAIRNVRILVIFYDRSGEPLDISAIRYRGVVSARLARRVSGWVDVSVRRLTTKKNRGGTYARIPSTKVEFRVLDFEFVE